MLYDVDDYDTTESDLQLQPFHMVARKSNADIIEWHKHTFHVRSNAGKSRILEQKNNVRWFTGEFDKTMEYQLHIPGQPGVPVPKKILPVVINHIYELTEQRTSKLSKYKTNFDCQPADSAEYKDRQESKVMKLCLDSIKRKNKFDAFLNQMEKWNSVYGEIYAMVEWDANAGDVMTTKKGRTKKDRKGFPKKNGDVTFKLKEPFYIFPEIKRHWEDVDEVIEIYKIMHIEDARKKWNKPNLKEDNSNKIFDFGDGEREKHNHEIVIFRILNRPSEYLPNGAEIIMTADEILEKNIDEWKYSHNDFPFERYTDIDVPGRLHGISFFSQLKPVQHQFNKLSSIIHRNHSLCAHPKWMMEAGCVNVKSLGNAATIVQVKRGTAKFPELASFPTTPQEVYEYRKELREELETLSGVHGVSRGEPPGSIRSGIALQFLEEQEMEGFATRINKRNDLIIRIYQKTASIVSDYYPTSDPDRLLRVVGKNNEYLIRNLDSSSLASVYDIVIQNSTALSESKAGKVDQIIQLRQQFGPGVIPDQYAVDALDLGAVEKIYDIATASLRAAESENRDILDGKPSVEPKLYEQHIIHWNSHMIEIQAREFKEDTPPEVQQAMFDHIGAHETLMEQMCQINQTFAIQVKGSPDGKVPGLSGYPAFLKPPPPPPQPPPMPMGPPPGPLGAPMPGPGGQMAPPPPMPMPIPPQNDINGLPPGQAGSPSPQGVLPLGQPEPAGNPAMPLPGGPQ